MKMGRVVGPRPLGSFPASDSSFRLNGTLLPSLAFDASVIVLSSGRAGEAIPLFPSSFLTSAWGTFSLLSALS